LPKDSTSPSLFESMLHRAGAEQERFRKQERREHHFPKILGSGASQERLFYIYITFIFNKNMQKDKLVAKYMKTFIFVLVDEYYIIMKFKMPSIVY
jgi:hypothetical protein